MFKKKNEFVLKTPLEAYKFTPGGLYILEVPRRAVTMSQIDNLISAAESHNIDLHVVTTDGDVVSLNPIMASDVLSIVDRRKKKDVQKEN